MSTTYSVVIPDDTFPGDNIVIEVDEQEYEILVPDGSAPGDTLQVELPEARNNQRSHVLNCGELEDVSKY